VLHEHLHAPGPDALAAPGDDDDFVLVPHRS
jgi:hypothetical protein